jgi:hypothetical protein
MEVGHRPILKNFGFQESSESQSLRSKGKVIFRNWNAWPYITSNPYGIRTRHLQKSGLKHVRFALHINILKTNYATFLGSGRTIVAPEFQQLTEGFDPAKLKGK